MRKLIERPRRGRLTTIMGLRGKRSPSQPVMGEVEHVGDHEPEGEGADLFVGDVEFAFDLLLDAGRM